MTPRRFPGRAPGRVEPATDACRFDRQPDDPGPEFFPDGNGERPFDFRPRSIAPIVCKALFLAVLAVGLGLLLWTHR